MTDFSKLAIGTKVYSIIHGWGKLLKNYYVEGETTKIQVKFVNCGSEYICKYNIFGYVISSDYDTHMRPELYLEEQIITPAPKEIKPWKKIQDIPAHLWNNAWITNVTLVNETPGHGAQIMTPFAIGCCKSGAFYEISIDRIRWCPITENPVDPNTVWRKMEGYGF